MLGALNLAASILAAGMIVLVAVAGGIWLTKVALEQPDPMRLGALGIYSLLVVVPTVVLAARR